MNIPKAVEGELFQDLDLPSKLLAHTITSRKPAIEVLQSYEQSDEPEQDDPDSIDWSFPQSLPVDIVTSSNVT